MRSSNPSELDPRSNGANPHSARLLQELAFFETVFRDHERVSTTASIEGDDVVVPDRRLNVDI